MASHQEPEIRRTGLDYLILQLKLLPIPTSSSSSSSLATMTAEETLSLAIQPPSTEAIRASTEFLRKLGTIEPGEEERLTPLGRHLATLPVGNVQVGKMVLFGAILGCVTPIVTVAAMLGAKSPFVSPQEKREEANAARDRFKTGVSDHLTLYNVYRAFEEVAAGRNGEREARKWCTRNFLSYSTLRVVGPTVRQYLQALGEAGFLEGVSPRELRSKGARAVPARFDRNAGDHRVLSAALCAGLYPNILQVRAPKQMIKTAFGAVQAANEARELKYFTRARERVFIHPRSVNFDRGSYDTSWLAYSSMMQTSKMYVHDCTQVHPYALLLFGDAPKVDALKRLVCVDGWIRFSAPGKIAVLMRELRDALKELLNTKIANPATNVASSPVVQVMLRLIAGNGH
mmetsp:Transcript_33946/g.82305  ORF Transcript_33946/g.82305 Transcript_33946/m.82305 type:complete len:401 (+) Transcript_33946:77-1279(+)